MAVWLAPLWSVQLMLTLSPGWYPLSTERILARRGDAVAGQRGDGVAGAQAGRCGRRALRDPGDLRPGTGRVPGTWLPDATSIPRNAVEPMCTVAEPVPASI